MYQTFARAEVPRCGGVTTEIGIKAVKESKLICRNPSER
jgi:hypothetical protein